MPRTNSLDGGDALDVSQSTTEALMTAPLVHISFTGFLMVGHSAPMFAILDHLAALITCLSQPYFFLVFSHMKYILMSESLMVMPMY